MKLLKLFYLRPKLNCVRIWLNSANIIIAFLLIVFWVLPLFFWLLTVTLFMTIVGLTHRNRSISWFLRKVIFLSKVLSCFQTKTWSEVNHLILKENLTKWTQWLTKNFGIPSEKLWFLVLWKIMSMLPKTISQSVPNRSKIWEGWYTIVWKVILVTSVQSLNIKEKTGFQSKKGTLTLNKKI